MKGKNMLDSSGEEAYFHPLGDALRYAATDAVDQHAARLLTLWDLVNKFNLWTFANLMARLEGRLVMLEGLRDDGEGSTHNQEFYQVSLGLLREVAAYAMEHEFHDCAGTVHMSGSYLAQNATADISTLAADVRVARDALMTASARHKFLRVAANLGGYVDQSELFGHDVFGKFPSARADVREAGNCLAADCNTAAVFHMMRAVEWGLRSLAASLGLMRITRRKKGGAVKDHIPLPYSDWEHILNQLQGRVDAKIAKLRPGKRKQDLQEFYYPALQDIRGIKDAWRNHVTHTRREYTATEALAILEHVKRFMVTLATRVSEV
jgi:hypothetical protein